MNEEEVKYIYGELLRYGYKILVIPNNYLIYVIVFYHDTRPSIVFDTFSCTIEECNGSYNNIETLLDNIISKDNAYDYIRRLITTDRLNKINKIKDNVKI